MVKKNGNKKVVLTQKELDDIVQERVEEIMQEKKKATKKDTKKSDYNSMTVKELKELVEEKDIEVEGTGSKGRTKKSDYVAALQKSEKKSKKNKKTNKKSKTTKKEKAVKKVTNEVDIDYSKMSVKELKELAKERDVEVIGTGSKNRAKKSDYVEALQKGKGKKSTSKKNKESKLKWDRHAIVDSKGYMYTDMDGTTVYGKMLKSGPRSLTDTEIERFSKDINAKKIKNVNAKKNKIEKQYSA